MGAQGRTALHRALGAGAPEICRFLLDKGANPQIVDSMKRTSLHWAAMAPSGACESCKLLFEFGLGAKMLDLQSKSGSTALHMAAEQGKADVVQLLLELGADRSLKDEEGKTAENLAKGAGHKDVVGLFGGKKKKPNVKRRSTLVASIMTKDGRRRTSLFHSKRAATVSPA